MDPLTASLAAASPADLPEPVLGWLARTLPPGDLATWVQWRGTPLPDTLLRDIATWAPVDVRLALAGRPDLPGDVRTRLASDRSPRVRAVCRTTPNDAAPPGAASATPAEPRWSHLSAVQLGAALGSATTPVLAAWLGSDDPARCAHPPQDQYLLGTLMVRHPALAGQVQRTYRAWALADPAGAWAGDGFPASVYHSLPAFHDRAAFGREVAARADLIPTVLLDRWAAAPEWAIRLVAAAHPGTGLDTLRRLLTDEDLDVVSQAILHPRTTLAMVVAADRARQCLDVGKVRARGWVGDDEVGLLVASGDPRLRVVATAAAGAARPDLVAQLTADIAAGDADLTRYVTPLRDLVPWTPGQLATLQRTPTMLAERLVTHPNATEDTVLGHLRAGHRVTDWVLGALDRMGDDRLLDLPWPVVVALFTDRPQYPVTLRVRRQLAAAASTLADQAGVGALSVAAGLLTFHGSAGDLLRAAGDVSAPAAPA